MLEEIQGEIGDGKIRDRGKGDRGEGVSDFLLTKRDLIGDVVREILPYLRKNVKQ